MDWEGSEERRQDNDSEITNYRHPESSQLQQQRQRENDQGHHRHITLHDTRVNVLLIRIPSAQHHPTPVVCRSRNHAELLELSMRSGAFGYVDVLHGQEGGVEMVGGTAEKDDE